MFSLLAAWLIQKSGKAFEKPQEFDDPNATISNILEVIRGNVRFLYGFQIQRLIGNNYRELLLILLQTS